MNTRLSSLKNSATRFSFACLTFFSLATTAESAVHRVNTSNFTANDTSYLILDKNNFPHNNSNSSETIIITGDLNTSFIITGIHSYYICITPDGIYEEKLPSNFTLPQNTIINEAPLANNPLNVFMEKTCPFTYEAVDNSTKKDYCEDDKKKEYPQGPSTVIFTVDRKTNTIILEYIDQRLSILVVDKESEDDSEKNIKRIAKYLDTIVLAPPLYTLPSPEGLGDNVDAATINKDIEKVRATLLALPNLADTLNTLLPAKFGDLDPIILNNHSLLYSNICQHFNELRCCPNTNNCLNLWSKFFGSYQNRETSGFFTGYNSNTNGVFIGLDCCPISTLCYGAGFAYTYDDVKWKNDEADATSDTYYGFLYSALNCRKYFLKAILSLSYSSIEGNRYITLPDQRSANHNNHAWSYGGRLNGGFNFYLPCQLILQLYDSVDLGNVDHSAFTESGATALNLHVNKHSYLQLRNELGMQLCANYFSCCNNYCWSPAIGLSWVYKNPLSHNNITARFQNQSTQFISQTRSEVTNQISPQASLTFRSINGTSLALYYDGEFGNGWNNNEFSIHFGKNF